MYLYHTPFATLIIQLFIQYIPSIIRFVFHVAQFISICMALHEVIFALSPVKV